MTVASSNSVVMFTFELDDNVINCSDGRAASFGYFDASPASPRPIIEALLVVPVTCKLDHWLAVPRGGECGLLCECPNNGLIVVKGC